MDVNFELQSAEIRASGHDGYFVYYPAPLHYVVTFELFKNGRILHLRTVSDSYQNLRYGHPVWEIDKVSEIAKSESSAHFPLIFANEREQKETLEFVVNVLSRFDGMPITHREAVAEVKFTKELQEKIDKGDFLGR